MPVVDPVVVKVRRISDFIMCVKQKKMSLNNLNSSANLLVIYHWFYELQMNAQQTAETLFYNLIQSELEQFTQSKEAIDQLLSYIENDDLLSLRTVLTDISNKQAEIIEQQAA